MFVDVFVSLRFTLEIYDLLRVPASLLGLAKTLRLTFRLHTEWQMRVQFHYLAAGKGFKSTDPVTCLIAVVGMTIKGILSCMKGHKDAVVIYTDIA